MQDNTHNKASIDKTLLKQALNKYIDEFEERENLVLFFIAKRLNKGRKVYGPIDPVHDSRSWLFEGAEELADMMVYLAAQDIRAISYNCSITEEEYPLLAKIWDNKEDAVYDNFQKEIYVF